MKDVTKLEHGVYFVFNFEALPSFHSTCSCLFLIYSLLINSQTWGNNNLLLFSPSLKLEWSYLPENLSKLQPNKELGNLLKKIWIKSCKLHQETTKLQLIIGTLAPQYFVRPWKTSYLTKITFTRKLFSSCLMTMFNTEFVIQVFQFCSLLSLSYQLF